MSLSKGRVNRFNTGSQKRADYEKREQLGKTKSVSEGFILIALKFVFVLLHILGFDFVELA